ncbi:hypothetical protein BVRB_028670, partial [Beta vulgaris subsp. vulgaris]
LKRSAEDSLYDQSIEDAQSSNQPATFVEDAKPDFSYHAQEQTIVDPSTTETSQLPKSEAEPSHSFNEGNRQIDIKQMRGQIKQLLASDQAAKKVMKGEMTRLSSFVYSHEQRRQPNPSSQHGAASSTSATIQPGSIRGVEQLESHADRATRDADYHVPRYIDSHEQRRIEALPPPSFTENHTIEDTTSRNAILLPEQKPQLSTQNPAEAE